VGCLAALPLLFASPGTLTPAPKLPMANSPSPQITWSITSVDRQHLNRMARSSTFKTKQEQKKIAERRNA
jgi:hypothetical protein